MAYTLTENGKSIYHGTRAECRDRMEKLATEDRERMSAEGTRCRILHDGEIYSREALDDALGGEWYFLRISDDGEPVEKVELAKSAS